MATLRVYWNHPGRSTASSSGHVTLDILLRPRRALLLSDEDTPGVIGGAEFDNGPETSVSLPVPLSLLGEPDLLAIYMRACVLDHLAGVDDPGQAEVASQSIAAQVLAEAAGHGQGGFNMGVEVEIVKTEEDRRLWEEWETLGQEFKARGPCWEPMEGVKGRIESFLRTKLLGVWKGILGDTYTYPATKKDHGIKRKRLEINRRMTRQRLRELNKPMTRQRLRELRTQ